MGKAVMVFTGEDAEQLDVYKSDVAEGWESFPFRLASRFTLIGQGVGGSEY